MLPWIVLDTYMQRCGCYTHVCISQGNQAAINGCRELILQNSFTVICMIQKKKVTIQSTQIATCAYSYVAIYICDRILQNGSKSHMKSIVFQHVFNCISI